MGKAKNFLGGTMAFAAAAAGGGAYLGFDKYLNSGELPQESLDPDLEPYQESYVCFVEAPDCNKDKSQALAVLTSGNQLSVDLEYIDDDIENAVVALENHRFWIDPNGIDELALPGAAMERRGASTIEMQLARNIYREDVPTDLGERKLWEMDKARALNNEYTKEEILEKYLNYVYFGRGVYGIEAAAQAYFGMSANDIRTSPLHGATLAAVLRGPDNYDGSDDPVKDDIQTKNLFERRNVALTRMLEEGYISPEEHELYSAVQIDDYVIPFNTFNFGSNFATADTLKARHFVKMIIDSSGYNERQLTNGLVFNTTLSYETQAAISHAVDSNGLPTDGRDMAIVALRQDGAVAGMYGGRFNESQVNLAFAPAPGGSIDKPYVVMTGLLNGYTMDDTFPDPLSYTWPNGLPNNDDWAVNTGGGHCNNSDACSLAESLRVSSNPVNMQLMQAMGRAGLEQMDQLMDSFGAVSDTPPSPAITLGSRETSPYHRAVAANGAFGNRGAAVTPYFLNQVLVQENGHTADKAPAVDHTPRKVIEPEIADSLIDALTAVALEGTAARNMGSLATLTHIASKTGTHDENRTANYFATMCIKDPTPEPNEPGEYNLTIMATERYVHNLKPLGRTSDGGNYPARTIRIVGEALVGEYCILND